MGRLNASGSPTWALLVSSFGLVSAPIIEYLAPKQAFLYIMGAAFSGLILSWVVSLAAHVSFRWRLTAEQVRALPMRSPLGIWGSTIGLVMVSIAITHTLIASRVNRIGGLIFFVGLTAAYILRKRARQAS
jgi:AAT family amino acid transporter/D-serine/D-alanine/glycine transporter